MRYKIPEEDYKKIQKHVSEVEVDFDGKNYLVYDHKKLSFFENKLNKVTKLLGASGFKEWAEPFVEMPFKLYGLMSFKVDDVYKDPKGYDFKSVLDEKLKKKLLGKVKGLPTSVEYYEKKQALKDSVGNITKNSLGQTLYNYENIIARIDFTFEFDDYGFITKKTALLKWYREDGKLSEGYKDLGKEYDPINDHEARVAEGELRRKSIVQGLLLPVMNKIKEVYDQKTPIEILSIGRLFLDEHDEAFRDFIDKSLSVVDENHSDYGKKVVWVEIRDYSGQANAWLDYELSDNTTIRQFIMDELI